MESILHFIWHDNELLGVDWSVWKIVGWCGNAVFFSRFIVQWYVSEKNKQVMVPQAFWWLSLIGSVTLLCYWLHQKDSVGIFAYAFTWFPYLRNLIIHRRNKKSARACAECGQKNPPQSNFCPNCGGKLA